MNPNHGSDCRTDKCFWFTCNRCSSQVFFYSCTCGSRVVFDEPGGNWPQHNCGDELPPHAYNPSNMDIFRNMQGVTQSVQGKNDGLLTGMMRATDSIDPVIRRVTQAKDRKRDTMAIPPYSGGKSETHIGVVTHTSEISLENKFGIAPDSIGARVISRKLGGLRVTQITIQVDEIAADPDAEDYLSYTFWCKPALAPKTLARHSVISATIAPTDIIGIPDTRWVAGSLEVIL